MADFLEVDFKEEKMEKLYEHVQLKNMQANPSVNMDKVVEVSVILSDTQRCFNVHLTLNERYERLMDVVLTPCDSWDSRLV